MLHYTDLCFYSFFQEFLPAHASSLVVQPLLVSPVIPAVNVVDLKAISDTEDPGIFT